MVKLVYRKTLSFWSRMLAVLVSLFSFAKISGAANFKDSTDENLSELTKSYNTIVSKIKALENKIQVIKDSGGSESLSGLQAEIAELSSQASSLSSNVSSLKSKIGTALAKVPQLSSSSYNF